MPHQSSPSSASPNTFDPIDHRSPVPARAIFHQMYNVQIKKRRLVPRQDLPVGMEPPAIPPSEILRFSIRDVVDAVAAVFDVRARHIEDRDVSTQNVERARAVAIQVAHEKGNSFPAIASYFLDPSAETMRLRSRAAMQQFIDHGRGRSVVKLIRDALSSVESFNALVMADAKGRRFKRAIPSVPVQVRSDATAELKRRILFLREKKGLTAKSIVKLVPEASPEYVADVLGVDRSFARMR